MANMLEGGGRTPLLPPAALQDLGFSIVAYPLSLLGVSVRAMQQALQGLQARPAFYRVTAYGGCRWLRSASHRVTERGGCRWVHALPDPGRAVRRARPIGACHHPAAVAWQGLPCQGREIN
jgi:hypothetical protein